MNGLIITIITSIITVLVTLAIILLCIRYGKKIVKFVKIKLLNFIKFLEKYRLISKMLFFVGVVFAIYYIFIFSNLDIDIKCGESNLLYRIIKVFYAQNAESIYINVIDSLYEFKWYGINYIFIIVMIKIINWIVNIIIDKNIQKKINNSTDVIELHKCMYNYIHDKNDKKPIVIVGEWGSGKTYRLNQFFDNYFNKSSKRKVYNISCFGVENKENLLNNIKDICEKEDVSLYRYIIKFVEKIPLVGDFLGKVLEKDYELNNLKENSIFIFDNFERIIPKEAEENLVISKYNIVSGVIDELIEKYNMKVIILANETEMVKSYVVDCFIRKLNARRFEIIPDENVVENVWCKILNSMKDLKNKNELEKIFINNKSSIIDIWRYKSFNIRVLQNVFYDFILFIDKAEKEGIEFEEEMINEKEGVLFTLLIISLFGKDVILEKNIFSEINPGECIAHYFERVNFTSAYDKIGIKKREIFELRNIFENVNARWYGIDSEIWQNIIDNYKDVLSFVKNTVYQETEYINKFNHLKTLKTVDQRYDLEDLIILHMILRQKFEASLKLILDNCSLSYGEYKNDEAKIFYINSIIEKYNLGNYFENNEYFFTQLLRKKFKEDFGGEEKILKLPISGELEKMLKGL